MRFQPFTMSKKTVTMDVTVLFGVQALNRRLAEAAQ
ncbi:hypothetical protein GGC63_001742 [Paenibacillus sp. OAS669]|nr:hypothetical protein [Paenibacillus sp. OAS669]